MEMEPVIQISSVCSLSVCLVLSLIYVGSLYIWDYISDSSIPGHNRDHPSTIKKRFFSVFIVMLISPLFVYMFSAKELFVDFTLWQVIGFRTEGIVSAIFLPLILTMILFLGPLSVQMASGIWNFYSGEERFGRLEKIKIFVIVIWLAYFKNLLWLRNHLVAPLSEELVFRSCMIPILLQSFSPMTSIYITPLFFGVAHLHHVIERIRNGMDKKTAIIISCFQFVYTSIFGIYSAYLFVRTGHFVAPFIAHAFCNHMGFPDFQELLNQPNQKRFIFCGLYILGLISWILLLPVLTNPAWFMNNLFYYKNIS